VTLTRKALLARTGAVVAAGAIAGCGSKSEPKPDAADLRDWDDVRGLYPLRPGLHHLDAFLLAPHTAPVAAAIARHRAGLDADPGGYLADREATLDDATAQAAAEHLGARPEEIALTDSTTMGLGLLYGGLRLRERDEVVTTAHDFYSTHEALRLSGARVRRIRLYRAPESASADRIVEAVRRGIGPRTRVLAITWVHSGTGVKLPLAEIATALPERVLLCVDAVHALGVEPPVDGPDFLVAGTHKWLAGPRGTGIVWGRAAAWEAVGAIIPPFNAGAGSAPGPARTPGGYHSFEHRWALADAFRLHAKIGPERIQARIHALATRLKDGLADAPGVTLKTPRDPALSSGLTCCLRDGEEPRATVERLRAAGVLASVTPYATPYVRFGTGLFSGEADVDAALRALRG
jgi:selenocysteine lyase/cysteine desulfurase